MKPIETDDVAQIEIQALVCTNERPEGKPCCKKVGGLEMFTKLKERLKAEGLYSHTRVTRSGCLGYCNDSGCVVAIHKKGKSSRWFTEITPADFEALWKEIVHS